MQCALELHAGKIRWTNGRYRTNPRLGVNAELGDGPLGSWG